MDVQYVDIEELKECGYNPRKFTAKKESELEESIKKYGLVEPIIVNSAENRKNIIIGGHFRYRVAKKLGIKKIPVVYIDIPDIEKEKELNIRLNKNVGEWDYPALADFDYKLLKEIGFNFGVYKNCFDFEQAEEIKKESIIQDGEIITIENNKIICADCFETSIYDNIPNPNIIIIDPMYDEEDEKIIELIKFLMAKYNDFNLFVFERDSTIVKIIRSIDIKVRGFLILKRAVKGNTPNYYYGTHTLIMHCIVGNAKKYKIGNGYGSTINIKKTNENIGYDKTIDTYMQLIKPFADEGDLVLDLFAGNFNALKVARILNLKSISIEKDKNKIQDFLDAQEKHTL